MSFRKLIYQSVIWRGLYFTSVLLLNVLVARHFEASYSGTIYFITNSYALVLLLLSLSLESGTGYYAATAKVAPEKLGNFAIAWSLLSSGLILTFALSSLGYFNQKEQELHTGLAALYYVGGCMLTNFFLSLFYAKQEFLLPNLILALINFGLIFLLGFSGKYGLSLKSFITIYFLTFLLQGVCMAILYLARNSTRWTASIPAPAELKGIFRFSLLALLANFIFFLVYRIDYWFVNAFCSPSDLGNYIQVSKLVQIFLILPTIIASVVFPQIAGGNKLESIRGLKLLCTSLLLLYGIACILLAISGQWVFPLVFGHSFENMYYPFLLIIPGIISLAILTPLSAYFAGENRVRVNIISSSLGLVVIVIGDLTLVPRFGIKAAALVSSLGYFVCLVFSLVAFTLSEKISITDVMSFGRKDLQRIISYLNEKNKIT